MNKLRIIVIAVFLSCVLIACGNTNDTVENENTTLNEENNTEDLADTTNETTQDTTIDPDQDKIITQMEKINFTEFELDLDYDNDVDYEVDLERESNGHYKVKLEDDINNLKLKGMEAFEHIYPIIENLSIVEDSNQDDVIEQVLNAFGLDDNYRKFELEVKYNNGVEKEYRD